MAERIVVRQNREYETEFLATPPDREEGELKPVSDIHKMTPYGMLMASLGTCTAIILHTFAQHHNLGLRTVELRLSYHRSFQKDCEDCEEEPQHYTEQIRQEIVLDGDLTVHEREKLFQVSLRCPIHRMLEDGIDVLSGLF